MWVQHSDDPHFLHRARLPRFLVILLLLNHNLRSWFPRVLGERCPMYDIEHIYLFDPGSGANDFESAISRDAEISSP
jgi:hypothetical protein